MKRQQLYWRTHRATHEATIEYKHHSRDNEVSQPNPRCSTSSPHILRAHYEYYSVRSTSKHALRSTVESGSSVLDDTHTCKKPVLAVVN